MVEFQEVYDEFYGRIRVYLARLAGEPEADDLTQEVFVKVNKSLAAFQGKCSLSTWVYRIATNTALDRLRSRARRQGEQTLSLSNAGADAAVDVGEEKLFADTGSLTSDREVIRAEMNECIREFTCRLPPDYQTVIVLSELKGLTNQEIADILGTSLGTVKIRLHRARVRLKEEFERGCEFYRDEENRLSCDRKEPES